ncbi:MAG: SusD/RagB family nutrient-binding outer membrane lipoprotein [Prevotellaceae bacterium]|jgi:hypothetical protein|nr:SusD/RagB family nutrient-binding outer membrane lipoprotein [Prevotellaceae bacterium]
MKKIKYYLSIFILFGITITSLNRCDDFGDMNYDPNKPSSPDTRLLFVQASRFVRDFHLTGTYDPWAILYVQYISEQKNIQYSNYQMTGYELTRYYTAVFRVLEDIMRLNNDESWKNTAFVQGLAENATQIAMCRTLRAYYYMHLTDATGMIPYSEALQAKNGNYTPKYDEQQSIYNDLFKELNEAYVQFVGNDVFPGKNYDILYKGDIANWKRFNASTRMQLAIKLFKRDEAKGKTEFAKAFSEGFIQENSQSFTYTYDINIPQPLYANMLTRVDFQPSEVIINTLLDYDDPRISAYAVKNLYGTYYGVPYGLTASVAATINPDTISHFNPKYYAEQNTAYLTTPSIMYLAAAEAAERGWITASAEEMYKKGIEKAFEQHGFTTTEFNTYYAQAKVAYTGTKDEKIAKIAMQKWIASYMQDSFEAWADWRRLSVPDLKVGPNSTIPEIPRRRMYVVNDANGNEANLQDAISKQGPDALSTRVWWDME